MLRNPSATPCPVPVPPQHRTSFLTADADDDTTANLEFTAAFGGSLRNTKPRRPQNGSNVSKREKSVLGFDIHEDVEPVRNGEIEIEAGTRTGTGIGVKGKTGTKKTALTKPARRAVGLNIGLHSSQIASRSSDDHQQGLHEPVSRESSRRISQTHGSYALQAPNSSRRLSEVPRRPTLKTERQMASLPEETSLKSTSTIVLKPPRRGTIYIPNEDTTMPSMYMGIFSPIKNFDALGKHTPVVEMTGIAAQMAKKRHARSSIVATSPERAPLHALGKNLQGSATVEDRPGQGGGKENIPPGHDADWDEKSGRLACTLRQQPLDHMVGRDNGQQHEHGEKKVSRLYEPTSSSMGRSMYKKPAQCVAVKPSWNSGPRRERPHQIAVKKTPPKMGLPAAVEDQVHLRKAPIPSRFIVPNVKAEPNTDTYPMLMEDLAIPSMYEDNWLSHQEISITQLVNNLFGASSAMLSSGPGEMLRIRLLEKYADTEHAMLYKRLQAALLFGALSVPTDTLRAAGRLSSDIGRRKAFTDLWLKTYNLSSLQAALEVVVGRQCLASSSRRSSGDSAARDTLQRFIETFLIRNEDGFPDEHGADRAAWSYQRTILRSLMLIKLLDITKTSPNQLANSCLFNSSSRYKSSIDVVKALFQLLNPSAGDPVRVLSHVGYTVTHSQYPLEEYDYQIHNLAVDLRDGVRLTRLVELLLYPSASQFLEHSHDPDSTTTVILPTGDLLSLTEGHQDWPLSQHLKFPCIGRATKLYNVQIALSALQGVRGMTSLAEDIKAGDIVDGYREKTVKLLWGLTSKWGLGGLVDWHDVEREIKRICRTYDRPNHNDFFDMLYDDEDGPARYQILLKSWAQAIASKNGLVVTNLTTSFADTRVFGAIVDEYEGYMVTSANHTETSRGRPLSERLRAMGCSEQFAGLFAVSGSATHGSARVFDRDFVLASLAFLCSRLLEPTKGPRAAVTIQRAWRQYWGRVLEARKHRLKLLAEGCAQAVRLDGKLQTEHENTGEGNICGQAVQPDDDQRHGLPVQCNDDGRTQEPETAKVGLIKLDPDADATLQQSPQNTDEEDIWLCL